MSGIQIPGLGFAKPNETLPPLPPDVLAAAASFEGMQTEDARVGDVKVDEENTEDANMVDGAQTAETKAVDLNLKTGQNEDVKMDESTQPSTSEPQIPPTVEPTKSEPMSIDAAEPPSLTDALEAMINGLEPAQAAQPTTTTIASANLNAEQPAPEGDHPEWEIDSSPYESSSESSSSSDDSSDADSESGKGYQLLGVEETARMLMEMEGGSDDEGGEGAAKAGGSGHLRTKNEVAAEVIPKPDITLTAEDKIEELGAVDQIVENILVIKAFTPGEYQVLDTGSVLCTAERNVLGAVWETIGKVLQPMYTVMFNTPEEIVEVGLEVGTKVYYSAAHATFVFTEPLKNLKGSDASNIHDEEVAEDEMEFSDDEKEADHKRKAKQKRKDGRFKNGERPLRGGGELHPLRNEVSAAGPSDGGLNYDDENDGPYKPLTRPPGFGQVPPTQQNFAQEPEPGRFGGRRGRGDFRGRGGRGRGRGRGRSGFGQREDRDGYSMPPQQQRQEHSQGQWGGNNNHQALQFNQQQQQQPQQSVPAPTAPTFNFPFPGMPPQPGAQGLSAAPPPPPPGWPAQGGQAGQTATGAYINPAFFAALLGQMQQNQAQNGQQSQQQHNQSQQPQQPQQPQKPHQPQQPPQPPYQWGAQPPPR